MKRGRTNSAKLMNHGIDAFDEIASSTDNVAKTAGVVAGVAAPTVAIAITGTVAEVSGGATILKTLALAGGLLGGGAVVGVTVIGVGAVGVGWGAMKLVQYFRGSNADHAEVGDREV